MNSRRGPGSERSRVSMVFVIRSICLATARHISIVQGARRLTALAFSGRVDFFVIPTEQRVEAGHDVEVAAHAGFVLAHPVEQFLARSRSC